MLEQGCIKTGAVCKFAGGGYAVGDLFHYNGCYIFRHRSIVAQPPRPSLHGEFIDWKHQWQAEGDLTITIGTERDFLYLGYTGRPIEGY